MTVIGFVVFEITEWRDPMTVFDGDIILEFEFVDRLEDGQSFTDGLDSDILE